jgi:hypothetical protein
MYKNPSHRSQGHAETNYLSKNTEKIFHIQNTIVDYVLETKNHKSITKIYYSINS